MFGKNKKTINRLPHEAFPDILFWEKNDIIKGWITIADHSWRFKDINEKGIITLASCNYGMLIIKSIESVFKDGTNVSLDKRKLDAEIKATKDNYFQYIQDFNKAYKQIST